MFPHKLDLTFLFFVTDKAYVEIGKNSVIGYFTLMAGPGFMDMWIMVMILGNIDHWNIPSLYFSICYPGTYCYIALLCVMFTESAHWYGRGGGVSGGIGHFSDLSFRQATTKT